MLTIVEPDDNINLAARKTRQVLDKTEQQGLKCGRNGTVFFRNRGYKPGLRKTTTDNKQASLKKIKARKKFSLESLILAQDERWRRA